MKEERTKKSGRPKIPAHRKKVKPNISLDPQLIEDSKKKAAELSMGLSEFVSLALARLIAKESGREMPPIPLKAGGNVVAMPERSHLIAAAGSPLAAEVQDWEGVNDTVLVKINGLSMVPLFNDGDVLAMNHKRGARSQFMKKGLIYLVEYGGGYTVKRYNTRAATAQEIEEGVAYVSKRDGKTKVKVLQSINSEFPEIVIKDEADWIAWIDPKKM